jgi:hypothetical protein
MKCSVLVSAATERHLAVRTWISRVGSGAAAGKPGKNRQQLNAAGRAALNLPKELVLGVSSCLCKGFGLNGDNGVA